MEMIKTPNHEKDYYGKPVDTGEVLEGQRKRLRKYQAEIDYLTDEQKADMEARQFQAGGENNRLFINGEDLPKDNSLLRSILAKKEYPPAE